MAYLIDIKTFTDDRGSLNSIDRVLPFDIKRLYYIYNVSENLSRGGHRHYETLEGLICMHGSFTVLIDNGREKTEYRLDTPAKVLLIEIGDWHVMYNLSPDAVLMGIASTNYDPKDYAYEPLKLVVHDRNENPEILTN